MQIFINIVNFFSYFFRIATVLNGLESSLAGYPEYRKVIMVSQIIQNYLDMALNELDKLSGEITLEELLRNNTELINLIKQSFKAAPEILEFFTTQPMKVNQVNLTAYINGYWFYVPKFELLRGKQVV